MALEDVMNSEDLKTEVLAWLRYLRKCEIVCTEAGRYSADVWGMTATRLIEVETKVSISDLRADFRKEKHGLYNRYAAEPQGLGGCIPNAFYFCLPADLVDKAQEFLKTVELPVVRKYGIIAIADTRQLLGRNAAAVVKAGRIHGEPPQDWVRETGLLRMASELCGVREAMRRHRQDMLSGFEHLTATMKDLYAHQKLQAVPELEEECLPTSSSP